MKTPKTYWAKLIVAWQTFVVWHDHRNDPRGAPSWALANDIRLYRKGLDSDFKLYPGINHERLNDWLFGPVSTMGGDGILTTKADLFNEDGTYKGNVVVKEEDGLVQEWEWVGHAPKIAKDWRRGFPTADPRDGAVILFRDTRYDIDPNLKLAHLIGNILKFPVPEDLEKEVRKAQASGQMRTVRWPSIEPLKESWSDITKKEIPFYSEPV